MHIDVFKSIYFLFKTCEIACLNPLRNFIFLALKHLQALAFSTPGSLVAKKDKQPLF